MQQQMNSSPTHAFGKKKNGTFLMVILKNYPYRATTVNFSSIVDDTVLNTWLKMKTVTWQTYTILGIS